MDRLWLPVTWEPSPRVTITPSSVRSTVSAILAALHRRSVTGEGARIEVTNEAGKTIARRAARFEAQTAPRR